MNRRYKNIVLFGRPGSGKDSVANILHEQRGYSIYDAVKFNDEPFMAILRTGGNPTSHDRDVQCLSHIIKAKSFMSIPLVVNWTFLFESQRELWRKAYPQTTFVYINTPMTTITKRLQKNPRVGHELTTKQAIAIGETFEEPIRAPKITLLNTGTKEDLEAQVLRIF